MLPTASVTDQVRGAVDQAGALLVDVVWVVGGHTTIGVRVEGHRRLLDRVRVGAPLSYGDDVALLLEGAHVEPAGNAGTCAVGDPAVTTSVT